MEVEDNREKAAALFEEAMQSEDMEYRADLLEKAARLNSESFEVFEELGISYLHLCMLDQAESALQTALSLEDDGWVHLYIGNLHYKRGDLERAEVEYQLGRQILFDVASPLWCIGDVRWAGSDVEGSEAFYRQAVELDSNSSQALARLGRFLIENDRRTEGEPYLREVLTCDPTDAVAAKWANKYLAE